MLDGQPRTRYFVNQHHRGCNARRRFALSAAVMRAAIILRACVWLLLLAFAFGFCFSPFLLRLPSAPAVATFVVRYGP